MRDYEELVRELREADEKSMCGECGMNLHSGTTKKGVLFSEAADAIEELSKRIDRAVDLYNRNIEKAAIYEVLLGISPEPPKEDDDD